MKPHEEKLFKDALKTAFENEIRCTRLITFIIAENIIFLCVIGVLLWIGH